MPFYNEEELVEDVVENTVSELERLDLDYELILVDDGSSDSTPEIVDRIDGEKQKVRAVHHPENEGYGRALATGFETAEKPLIFYTDGDGQFDISELEKFLEDIENSDIVAGFREDRQDGFMRRLTGQGFNSLAQFMLPIEVQDIDCAFKLVRSEVLENIELETQRTVDAELLAKAAANGFRVKELPVEHYEREDGESEAEGLIGVRFTLILKSIEELWQIRRSIK